ncbi:aminoacyl-tRNA hydrolase [Oceanibaculum nanhaiense]|uniref:aminoacyl-tRNA hydrolase n=1 Tax=Oceanibaculum nanhaiense TaxID=1909734 RepID=UPI003F7257EA
MLLLAGLGNPGPGHANQRHNIGFMAVDEIVRRHGFGPWRARFQGLASEGLIAGHKVLALKPLTYMNNSGHSIGEAVRFFKLPPQDVFIVHDELDLKPGKIKVKLGGGHGGHNGLRSVDAAIGKEYWRIRLGIGHPGDKDKVLAWVLNDFAKAEQKAWLVPLLDAVAAHIDILLQGEGPGRDEGHFMSKVTHAVFPPPPKAPPKPKNPEAGTAPAAETPEAGNAPTPETKD